MKFLKFIIKVTIFGWCLSLVHLTGCKKTPNDSIIIAPNVFTPTDCSQLGNKDENDFFIVKSSDDKPVSLKVFTRANVLIFSEEAILCVWDGCSLSGEPMATGIYYYTAEIIDSNPKVKTYGYVYLYREK